VKKGFAKKSPFSARSSGVGLSELDNFRRFQATAQPGLGTD